MKSLKFLLVDDHPLFRKAVRDMLEEQSYVDSIHELEDGSSCIHQVLHDDIDVVLLDINMPRMDGIETMKELKKLDKPPTVIILTQFDDQKFYNTLMALGSQGYLMKSTTEEDFLEALGEILFENKKIINRVKPKTEDEGLLGNREKQVLALICQQLSSEDIAKELCISIHTVSNHRKNILRKLNVSTVAGMVHWASENDIA